MVDLPALIFQLDLRGGRIFLPEATAFPNIICLSQIRQPLRHFGPSQTCLDLFKTDPPYKQLWELKSLKEIVGELIF